MNMLCGIYATKATGLILAAWGALVILFPGGFHPFYPDERVATALVVAGVLFLGIGWAMKTYVEGREYFERNWRAWLTLPYICVGTYVLGMMLLISGVVIIAFETDFRLFQPIPPGGYVGMTLGVAGLLFVVISHAMTWYVLRRWR
jgi:hypothetical protein